MKNFRKLTKQGLYTPKRVRNFQRIGKEASIRKSKLKRFPTEAEIEYKNILMSRKIPFKFQQIVCLKNMYYIVDFIVKMNPPAIFEIDGSSHAGKEEYDLNRTKDLIKAIKVKIKGKTTSYKMVRIKNESVFNGEAEIMLSEMYPKKLSTPSPLLSTNKES